MGNGEVNSTWGMIRPPSESRNMGMGGMSRERKVKGLLVTVSRHSSAPPLPLPLLLPLLLLLLLLAAALALLPSCSTLAATVALPVPGGGFPPLVRVVSSIVPPKVVEMMLDGARPRP